jgi:hypothetical protein
MFKVEAEPRLVLVPFGSVCQYHVSPVGELFLVMEPVPQPVTYVKVVEGALTDRQVTVTNGNV